MAKFTAAERSGLIFLLVLIALVTTVVLLTRNTIQIHQLTLDRPSTDSIVSATDSIVTPPDSPTTVPSAAPNRNKTTSRQHLNELLPAESAE